jgi:signal transduction histidine kinase
MRRWLGGKRGGLIAFLIIASLVAGGLGWATAAALGLEQEQLDARAQDQLNARLRVALWRLDSRIWPALAKEESRPYNDYSAVYTPPMALRSDGMLCQPASIVLPSPLLNAELPNWMTLHFRIGESEQAGNQAPAVVWGSPQVLSESLRQRLDNMQVKVSLTNVTAERRQLLTELAQQLTPATLLTQVQQRGAEFMQTDTAVVPTGNPDNNDNSNPTGIAGPAYKDGQTAQTSAGAMVNGPAPQQTVPAMQQPSPAGQQIYPFNAGKQRAYNNSQNVNSAYPQQSQELLGRDNEYQTRLNVRSDSQKEVQNKAQVDLWSVASANTVRNGEGLFSRHPVRLTPTRQTVVSLGPMVPVWLTTSLEKGSDPLKSRGQTPFPDQNERLIVARLVHIGDRELCQGIVLDWPKLQELLSEVVSEEFPEARFEPEPDYPPLYPERTMTALPIRLDSGVTPAALSPPSWTPLRIGLALAWTAALVALLTVGLGGWSLIDLSQRRIRFVSAVTHELRTPLTTLRLYLDMLTGGLVQDESQKAEYLQTLNTESERLNRLVSNVLDFSRLENQCPRLEKSQVVVADLLEQVHTTWEGRCRNVAKELTIESSLGEDAIVFTDVQLVQQILGNLIDNACKYSQGAEDRRIWLRARKLDGRLVLEVEDRGPGVAPAEQRSIFRPFLRGRGVDATAGGVGLGLALAQRWAQLLGGRLTLGRGTDSVGACFRLELPVQSGA